MPALDNDLLDAVLAARRGKVPSAEQIERWALASQQSRDFVRTLCPDVTGPDPRQHTLSFEVPS